MSGAPAGRRPRGWCCDVVVVPPPPVHLVAEPGGRALCGRRDPLPRLLVAALADHLAGTPGLVVCPACLAAAAP